MKRGRRWRWGLMMLLSIGLTQMTSADDAPPTDAPQASAPPGWKLFWSDEFNGDSIDRTKWKFETGNRNGWGNRELEDYTNRPENAFVQDGMLHIRAIKEHFENSQYTSARMVTHGLFSKLYGRFEFRAKLPVGKGLWPALWMMPEQSKYGGWPLSGEIDVMEGKGQNIHQVIGTIHYGIHGGRDEHSGANYNFPDDGKISDFHVYAVEWEPNEIRWYVDDHLYSTKNKWRTANAPYPAPFDQPFHLIMNLAVGGNFLGNPDASSVFPQELVVDYVRVYDKVGGYAKAATDGQ
jgi:beta-glucanase (GH16 family)